METVTEARLLILFIALLSLVGCMSWCLMSWVVRICPLASRHFALSNLLIFSGTLLIYLQNQPPSFGFWFTSNASMLAGFYFLYTGLVKLFKLSGSSRVAQSILVLALIVLWPLSHNTENFVLIGVVFSIAASSLFGYAAWANYRGIKQEFNTVAALSVSSPFALVSLFFIIRIGFIFHTQNATQDYISIKHPDSLPQLWFLVVLTIVINLSLVGNAFARLVTKIRSLADRDSLTGLWTRRIIDQQLLNQARICDRHHSVFSILLIDLDYFKKINDRYGHQIGDQALLHASNCFKDALRDVDWLARYGGEEFLALLPDTGQPDAVIIAERLRQQLSAQPFTEAAELQLTASVGIASYYARDNTEQLIASADQALYQAKAKGRNQVCLSERPTVAALVSEPG
ncbi:diguanylate cyclase [Arsukibacterium sp.]|uniref:GGDEF domain-containing protein n=1 Tax=Arsukibacterium sp. TaxID=1977258 RepID=UPI0035618083